MHNMKPFTKVARMLIDQDADPLLLIFKKHKLGEPFDEQILGTNPRYIH